MLVLGIESSCDETGIALYDDQHGLLSHTLHSQIAMHEAYGGVVPELASRAHIEYIVPLLQECLRLANKQWQDIDAIAYTQGPGLAGALMVGASVACSLGMALHRPIIPIHHLEGHLLSPLLAPNPPSFPFTALLVSGGHTQIFKVEGVGRYELLGDTLDDAAGEAFDKTAKMLGLAYPGGPALAQLAEQGDAQAFQLPRPMLHSAELDFSFSGLKTAVLTLINKQLEEQGLEPDRHGQRGASLPLPIKANIAAAFQAAMVEVLSHKLARAGRQTGHRQWVVAGGVGANRALRQKITLMAERMGIKVDYPPLSLCTDNGAMIALAGSLRRQEAQHNLSFTVRPRWPLHELHALAP